MTAFAASAGLAADRLLGEPPARWHPVVWFGSTMNAFESRWYADTRTSGMAYTLVGVAVAAGPAWVIRRVAGAHASTVLASAVAIAGAMLEREALRVADALLVDDLTGARRAIGGLVGRSTDELDAVGISRAVVETVAENTVDAVTATLFWGSVGGAPGVLVHRAINTMDAMVGDHSDRFERFGFVSARCDDVANWLPARLTAVAVAVVTPSRAAQIWRTVRRDARMHPSPNGGVIEAAFAGALGVRLGGTNVYDGVAEYRGVLGSGRPATPHDITRSTELARRTGYAVAAGCVVAGQVTRVARRRGRSRRGRRD